MSVRNSQEIGPILTKVAIQLANDQELCRYLYYTDNEPQSKSKKDLDGYSLLNKNILVVPQINAKEFDTASKICLLIPQASVEENIDFKNLSLSILVYTPFKSWILNDTSLRPFMIIGCIERLLKDKRYESLGQIKYDGFELHTIDDNLSSYRMDFRLDIFN